METKPFHQWKAEQILKDSKEHGVFRYYRLREWYYTAYGAYCLKVKGKDASNDS